MRPKLPLLVATALLLPWLSARSAASEPAKPDPSHREVLSNAASLLANLLQDEKNLNKILVIKGHSPEFGALVDAISHAATGGETQLEALAKKNPEIDLKALGLPPGEQAARKAMAKTKEHELLFSSGDNFAFNLLITQTDALGYGSHLAELISENASEPEDARQFHSLAQALERLLQQVTAAIRSLPAK